MKKNEITNVALNFIKARTARGGDRYEEYEEWNNDWGERCFEKWHAQQSKITGKAYRGYQLSQEQLELYKVGSIIKPNQIYCYEISYPSFTRSEMRAHRYTADYLMDDDLNPVKVIYEVELKGIYCVDISKYSIYESEAECLFSEDAKLKITSIERKGMMIYIRLDEEI